MAKKQTEGVNIIQSIRDEREGEVDQLTEGREKESQNFGFRTGEKKRIKLTRMR